MLLQTFYTMLPIGLALATPTPNDLAKRYNYDIQKPGAFDVVASGVPFLGEDGGYGFYFQTDGNFVIYDDYTSKASDAVWSSNTAGHNCQNNNCHLTFQTDGNLVIYVDGKAIWNTNTASKGSELYFRNTPSFITIYGPQGGAVYASNPPPIPIPPCIIPGGYCP